jgi:hypothetical protein
MTQIEKLIELLELDVINGLNEIGLDREQLLSELQNEGDGWISVDDRLPPVKSNYDRVLVCLENKSVWEVVYVPNVGFCTANLNDGTFIPIHIDNPVTHYRTLPSPPKP